MLQASCPNDNTALTPPARLAIVAKRLDTMQQAVKTVRNLRPNRPARATLIMR